MRLSNLLPLFFVLSCTDQAPSLIKRFSAQEKISAERAPSNSPQKQCFSQRFSVPDLKEEVKVLEEGFKGAPVEGKWRHLFLRDLPVAQATFLKEFGEKIGDLKDKSSINYDGCHDVPCIINRIYGEGDSVAGYVHYIWYLRMGSMLSADNHIPSSPDKVPYQPGVYKNTPMPLSSFLYSEQELYAFWRMTHLLKNPFTQLTNMREIQRIPKGMTFDFAGPSTCGMAHSSGFIILHDRCLDMSEGLDNSNLYLAVIHEIGHMLDYHEGIEKYGDWYRSQQQDYLNLSGFSKIEHLKPDGTVMVQWKLEPHHTTVRPYGSSSPAENFADFLAFYRSEGDETKRKMAPAMYELAKKDYFHGNAYHLNSLFSQWSQSAVQQATKDTLEMIVACGKSPDPACRSQKTTVSIEKEIANLKADDPDACRYLSNFSHKLSLQTALNQVYSSSWDKLSGLNPETLGQFLAQQETMNPDLAYDSYLKCKGTLEEKTCYEHSIAQSLNELAEIYVSLHPYQDISEEVNSFYRNLITSQSQILTKKVDRLWSACKGTKPLDTAPPKGDRFTISGGYMVSSLYNCLNEQFDRTLEAVVNEYDSIGLSASMPQEKAILLEKLEPLLKRALTEKYVAGRELEKKDGENYMQNMGSEVRALLLKYKTWSKNKTGKDAITRACIQKAPDFIGNDYWFYIKRDLFKEFFEKNVCYNIHLEL